MKLSLTVTGIVTFALGWLLTWANIPHTSEEIMTGVGLILKLVGALMTYWGRYRQGDITWYGMKK